MIYVLGYLVGGLCGTLLLLGVPEENPIYFVFLVVGAILAYAIYSESKKEDKNRKKLHIMWIICLLIYGVGMGVGIVIGTSWAINAFYPSSEGSFSLRFGSGSSSGASRYNGGSSDDIFSVNSADYDKLDREAKYIRDYTNRDIPSNVQDMLNNRDCYDSAAFDYMIHELEREREYRQANGLEERH